MKQLLTILLFSMFLPMASLHAHVAPAASFDAMVVLAITDLDDAALAKLSAEIGRSKQAYMEYSCTWSGVVVIKYSDISTGERADVMTMARRSLSAAGLERGVEFLHVHIEGRGVGKC